MWQGLIRRLLRKYNRRDVALLYICSRLSSKAVSLKIIFIYKSLVDDVEFFLVTIIKHFTIFLACVTDRNLPVISSNPAVHVSIVCNAGYQNVCNQKSDLWGTLLTNFHCMMHFV